MNDIWGKQGYVTGKTLSYLKDESKDVVLDGSRQTYNLTIAITEKRNATNGTAKTVWIAANLTDMEGENEHIARLMQENHSIEREQFFRNEVAATLRKAQVVEPQEAFDLVFLPANQGEHNLHSELRVFRELIGRKVIGKGQSGNETLLDFGGSKANCLLCANQILDGLGHLNFFKGTKNQLIPQKFRRDKKFPSEVKFNPFPQGFRKDKDENSIQIPYHLSTTTPNALTMVPVEFYKHYRDKKLKAIIQSHWNKSLRGLKDSDFGGNYTENNEKSINDYFGKLLENISKVQLSKIILNPPQLENGWTQVNNRNNKKRPSNIKVDALTIRRMSRMSIRTSENGNSSVIIDQHAIHADVLAHYNAFPSSGKLSIANHLELQTAFIDAVAESGQDYKFHPQNEERFEIPSLPQESDSTSQNIGDLPEASAGSSQNGGTTRRSNRLQEMVRQQDSNRKPQTEENNSNRTAATRGMRKRKRGA